LKLTTDRHEASRGLFATAELLVTPYGHIIKLQSNRPLYNNTAIDTVDVDGWAVIMSVAYNTAMQPAFLIILWLHKIQM